MSSGTLKNSSSPTSSILASQVKASSTTSRSLMRTSIVTEQGADAPPITHTRDAAPPPPTLQPPPFADIARSAKKQDTSIETASTTFAKDATAGAWGILCPTAQRPRQQNRRSGTSSVAGTMTGENAKEPHGSLWTPGQGLRGHGPGCRPYPTKNGQSRERSSTSPPHPLCPPLPLLLPSPHSPPSSVSSGTCPPVMPPPSFWQVLMSVTSKIKRGVMI